MRNRFAYIARILSLILATISGIFFTAGTGQLIWVYRTMPGIVGRSDIIISTIFGILFLFSIALYLYFVRKTRGNSITYVP